MTDPQVAALAALLREQGWEPDTNVCRCGHLGGEHDLGNWCLTCPRPDYASTGRPFSDRLAAGWDYFASWSEDELWAKSAARLVAAGVRVGDDGLQSILRRSPATPTFDIVTGDGFAVVPRSAVTPVGIDAEQGIVQRAHVPCCWCGEHHEEGR